MVTSESRMEPVFNTVVSTADTFQAAEIAVAGQLW